MIIILFAYIFSNDILIETGSSKNVKGIYSVDIKEKKVAISFDEGMEVNETDELLEVLDKYNAKATFFVIGEWVEEKVTMVDTIFTVRRPNGQEFKIHGSKLNQ